MARPERKALIESIEQMRNSRVIVYVTGDRPPWGAQIGNDAIRPLYDHLRQLNSVEALDLFIYSRGGRHRCSMAHRDGAAHDSGQVEHARAVPGQQRRDSARARC